MKAQLIFAFAACLGTMAVNLWADGGAAPTTNALAMDQAKADKLAIQRVFKARWFVQTNVLHPEFLGSATRSHHRSRECMR